jgi:small subunit ribosomal protein S17
MAEKNRKTRVGRVVSDKMEKTVVVAVKTTKTHPLYKKLLRRTTKFMAHDEKSQARIGDLVRIVESRPISKLKTWRLLEVMERKQQAQPVEEIATAGVDVLERKPVAAALERESPAEAQEATAVEEVTGA